MTRWCFNKCDPKRGRNNVEADSNLIWTVNLWHIFISWESIMVVWFENVWLCFMLLELFVVAQCFHVSRKSECDVSFMHINSLAHATPFSSMCLSQTPYDSLPLYHSSSLLRSLFHFTFFSLKLLWKIYQLLQKSVNIIFVVLCSCDFLRVGPKLANVDKLVIKNESEIDQRTFLRFTKNRTK